MKKFRFFTRKNAVLQSRQCALAAGIFFHLHQKKQDTVFMMQVVVKNHSNTYASADVQ